MKNMSDILHSLGRMEFPAMTKAALHHLEACVNPSAQSNIPGLGEELAEKIIHDYIFRLPGRRESKKLTVIQELTVLKEIIEYFDSQSAEIVRHGVFQALFGIDLDPYAAGILNRLISMAVGVRSVNVLHSAAMWMQAEGCNSELVTGIAKVLVDDYCHLVPGASHAIQDLPSISKHFTCNFITAVTGCYQPQGSPTKATVPKELLILVADWISSDPNLCLVSLINSPHANRTTLWTSPTKANTQTPVPGIVKWCTKAPLLKVLYDVQVNNSGSEMCINNSSVGSNSKPNSSEQDLTAIALLYSKLHLALLESISALRLVPGAAQMELITLADMNKIVKDVTGLIRMVPGNLSQSEGVQIATDRLVQVLQVALATGGFRCSLADLKSICMSMPPCQLLSIIMAQHLSTAPPQMHNVRM